MFIALALREEFQGIRIIRLQVCVKIFLLYQLSFPTAITLGPPSETTGEVKGFSFVYSGNFLFEAEINEMGRLRVNMGIHPMSSQWHLKPGTIDGLPYIAIITGKLGGSFSTPEVVLVRSSEGLGGMSRALHRLFLDRLLPRNWSDETPPILLNSWEAKYFQVNHHNIVEMARQV